VHLKSTALLYDIRQKKPTVNIKEGIFYNGIENYSLRVGKKSENKDTLKDIYIYDHSAHLGNTVQMYARTGKITTTSDTSALVLILKDGNRYEENTEQENTTVKKTLSQLNFKELEVNIPLEDFKFKRTNEELFKGNEEMLNVWQLDSVADSTRRVLNRKISNLLNQSSSIYYSRLHNIMQSEKKFPEVKISDVYNTLPAYQYTQCVENALNIARSASGSLDGMNSSIGEEENSLRRYLIEWHSKLVICFACIVLFFVGAPLGAIIKKGGLGLPVIVAVFFFLAYYILTEMFHELALEGAVPPWQAIWTPLLIFLPVSIFLTYKAANDSVIFDLSSYYSRLLGFFQKKQNENTATL